MRLPMWGRTMHSRTSHNNTIDPNSNQIFNVWSPSAYKTIYQSNAIIEGIRASTPLPPHSKTSSTAKHCLYGPTRTSTW